MLYLLETSDTLEHLLRSKAAEVSYHIRGDRVQADEIRSARPPDRGELIPVDLARETRDAAKNVYQQKARVKGEGWAGKAKPHFSEPVSSDDGGDAETKAKKRRNRRNKNKGADGANKK